MTTPDASALDTLFRNARTQNGWTDQPVSDDELRALYDLAKWGPTSANCQPMRVLFARTAEAKERLAALAMAPNQAKIRTAPVVAIVGYDPAFYELLPRLFPHAPGFKDMFAGNAAFAETTAFRNGTLQGAYLMLAARAVGLDCGPMSGFDNAAVDAAFWAGTTVKSNFICALGHGDPTKVYPRSPRLDFEEACKLL